MHTCLSDYFHQKDIENILSRNFSIKVLQYKLFMNMIYLQTKHSTLAYLTCI